MPSILPRREYSGVDCELRLDQVVDFVGGLFGKDPLSDDRAVTAAVSEAQSPVTGV